MHNQNKKLGAITVEVGIGIALAVIVLIIAIGLFNDNLAAMVSNSGISNMFNNTNKSTYDNFNRDYTNSQVNVQLIGEQGLSMLRNIANNKAITQIDKLFDGTDTSITNANSIAYLSTVINAIVGSPNICVYMKKDSTKKCEDDPGIAKTLYNVNINGSSVTISKANSLTEVKTATMGGDFSSGAQGITITTPRGPSNAISPMTSGYGPAGITDGSIYTYIKYLSFFADDSNTVYDYDILIKKSNAGSGTGSIAQLANQLIDKIFNYSASSLLTAHNNCTGYLYPDTHEGDINAPAYANQNLTLTDKSKCGTSGQTSTSFFVYNEDLQSVNNYVTEFTTMLNSFADNSSNSSVSTTDVVNTMISAPDFKNFITILQKDHSNGTCDAFNNNIKDIFQANNVNVTLPDCTPFSNENTSTLSDIWNYAATAANAGWQYVKDAATSVWNAISSLF